LPGRQAARELMFARMRIRRGAAGSMLYRSTGVLPAALRARVAPSLRASVSRARAEFVRSLYALRAAENLLPPRRSYVSDARNPHR
jgi:hypothetical protein